MKQYKIKQEKKKKAKKNKNKNFLVSQIREELLPQNFISEIAWKFELVDQKRVVMLCCAVRGKVGFKVDAKLQLTCITRKLLLNINNLLGPKPEQKNQQVVIYNCLK